MLTLREMLNKIYVTMYLQTSPGNSKDFDDLRVGVYNEIVPMGISPDEISFKHAGKMAFLGYSAKTENYFEFSPIK